MKRLLPFAWVTVMAACGGDDLPVAGTSASSQGAVPPAAVKIDGASYLDAFAIATVALSRVIDAAHIVGIVSHGTSGLDPPGAQDCWAIGALEWHDEAAFARTSVERPCLSGSVELRSGTFESAEGATREDDWSLDLTLTKAVWRHPPSDVDQAIGGNMGLKQNAARVTAGSLQVRSHPFAPRWLTVAVSDAGAKVSVTAQDGMRVVASDATSGTTSARRFEVFDVNGSSPVVTQTLSTDDPLLVAALARAQG